MPQGPRVLVVDGVSDTEEVLRAVLEPRGVAVCRDAGAASGSGAGSSAPALIVIDTDHGGPHPSRRFPGVPQIILGRTAQKESEDCRILPKPFHYADLVRAIEQVIAGSRR